MDGQPLKPLTHGNILIVGAKASNFNEEIKTHPRVIIWDSQNENWIGKSLPVNVQAVFVTRWVGHVSFGVLLAEARKRHITMFNPEGTGIIAKQVKELLAMNKQPTIVDADRAEAHHPVTHKGGMVAKLNILLQYVDWDKSNTDNAKEMTKMLDHHGITSTMASLANFVGVQRKKLGITAHTRNTHTVVQTVTSKTKKVEKLDVAVQMLDEAISQLRDMRAFLVATTEENTKLRARLDMFKKALEE